MSRKKQGAVPADNSTPFFARYLEGQEEVEAARSAKVEGRKGIAYKKAEAAIAKQTLKYPSDRDELEYRPYYANAADVPKEARGASGRLTTLKFPSDRDEDSHYAHYVEASDVPTGSAKPKATVNLRLKKRNVKL